MKVEQLVWENGWDHVAGEELGSDADLVMLFAQRELLEDSKYYEDLRGRYPSAHIASVSTSGEIALTEVNVGTLTVTAIKFAGTPIQSADIVFSDYADSFEAGKALAGKIPHEGLRHVCIFSDGQHVNGSELIKGINSAIGREVSASGGLAGDGAQFTRTLVGLNQPPDEGKIVIIGFYGDRIKVGHGSKGGWEPFGPVRKITKAEANVLYELDGKPALDLYKTYLGEKAAELPASALLFPILINTGGITLVRTVLNVDPVANSITFAGDMPVGSTAQLMKTNYNDLVEAAGEAAEDAKTQLGGDEPQFALLVSCVGRRLVLNQRVDEEVEEVRNIFGKNTVMAGFYSYGELSPGTAMAQCELHNQTMTITAFYEN